MIEVLKVSAKTDVGKLAGSISKNLEEGKIVQVVAIGAGPDHQATKAVATASGHAGSKNKRLDIGVGFSTVSVIDRITGQEENKTAVVWTIQYK